jgi:hypothetical protein
VWPFSLRGKVDAFWAKLLGEPWRRRDRKALRLMHALLGAIAIRHSKSQVRGSSPGAVAVSQEKDKG